MARPCGEGNQVVIVDEVVTAEGDEDQGLVYELLSFVNSYKGTDPLLVLLEVLQLLEDSDNIQLQNEDIGSLISFTKSTKITH